MSSSQRYYSTRYTDHSSRDEVWAHIASYLSAFLPLKEDASVLEIGAGYGSWIRVIHSRNRHALDLNPEIDKLFKERGIIGVQTHVASCTDLSAFADGSQDLILASNLLEHLVHEDVECCLNEIHRVLKPKGRICLIQPNFAICPRSYFDDYTHRTIFTDVSLCDWLKAKNFVIDHHWKKFLPLTMKDRKAIGLGFLVPFYLRSPWKPFAGQMAIIASKKA